MLTFSPGLSSSLLAATTKAQWCQIIIDALGASRRIICKRSDSAGDVWGTGTTFFNAALAGEMAVIGNELANLGVVGAVTTQAAADLATGFAVMRIEGATSGVWIQGTLGLGGSGRDFIQRANLSASGMGMGIKSSAVIKAPSRLPLTPPDPPAGDVFNSLTLVNTSGSTQAANFITPQFGMPIKQGDCPAGKHVRFELEDGTECPSTATQVTTWPDGSRKMAGYVVRVPVAIAGSGTLVINAKTTDTAPAASGRTTADLTAANLILEVVGSTALSGTWTAGLNDGISSNTEIVAVADGPAGRLWRIGSEFKQSGAAHGQLYCHHYVWALNNSSGGLLGLRYLGRAVQPWADVTSPAPATRVMTGALKSGATTLRTLQGTSASETAQANISMDAYTSFATCGTDAKYDFVQGGGSASADCTIRVVHGKNNFIRTKLIAPFNQAQTVSSSASVDYRPFCRGSMQRYMPGTGERNDIGLLPSWCAAHLLNQSAVDERVIRVNAMAAGGWRVAVRQYSTRNIVAACDIQASYTNLGTLRPTWRFWPAAYMTGVANPASWASYWAEEFTSHHRPSAFYYAYLVTGELQYLDMMTELAATTMLNMEQNTQNWVTTQPVTNPVTGGYGERNAGINGTTYKGAGLYFRQDVHRWAAWGSRDVADAAAMLPDTGDAWIGARAYLRDVLAKCGEALDAYNALMPSSWRDSGLFCLLSQAANDQSYESPWATGYLVNAVCHITNALPGGGLENFRTHLSKFGAGITAAGFDVGCWGAYRLGQYLDNNQRITTTTQMVFQIRDCTITFSTATNRGTLSGPNSGWNFTNGDIVMFSTVMDSAKPFAEAVNNRRLYVVNASGGSAQFSLTPGGSVITVTSNASISNWMVMAQNLSPRWSPEGYNGSDSYVANIYSALRHLEACGESVNAARTRQDANLAASSTVFTSDAKNAYLAAYPA